MRLFALKNRSRRQSPWVYEILDPGKKVIGTFPTATMAERKMKELGIIGTIRPSKRTVEEAKEIARKSRKSRLLKDKEEKPSPPKRQKHWQTRTFQMGKDVIGQIYYMPETEPLRPFRAEIRSKRFNSYGGKFATEAEAEAYIRAEGKKYEAPRKAVPGSAPIVTVSGKELKANIEKYCAIGGMIPLVENPMFVLDDTHVCGYRSTNPFTTEMFAGEKPKRLLEPISPNSRTVVKAAELKRIGKNLSAKRDYKLLVEGDFADRKLLIRSGGEEFSVPIAEEMSPKFPDYSPPVRIWFTVTPFIDFLKKVSNSEEYVCIGVRNDGFAYVWTEDDRSRPLEKLALGLPDGEVKVFTSRYPVKQLLMVTKLFSSEGNVRIDLDKDWPISFGCDGGSLEALVAPRRQY